MWIAFCDLIEENYQGLAIYTCFPLFAKYVDIIKEMIIGKENMAN
jgi:hypothetical protein